MGIIIALHVIVCIALIGLILVQRGRGGGFVDSFQGLETVFGTKTSSFLTKSTTVLAVLFFLTCLSLALISLRQSRSLIQSSPAAAAAHNMTPVQPPAQPQSPAQGEAPGRASAQGNQTQAAPQAQPPAQSPVQSGNQTQSQPAPAAGANSTVVPEPGK